MSKEEMSRISAKWIASVDDVPIPMPRRRVRVSLVRELASIPEDYVLVRDHNSPQDVVLLDDQEIDLAEGNVIYRIKRCDVKPRGLCGEEAKRAWAVNDVVEVTIRSTLSGKSLRELFALPQNSHVYRDTEGPNDTPVSPDDELRFEDGPVFISREAQSTLKITVNSQVFTEHDGVKPEMTGQEIAKLVYPDPSATRIYYVSDGNRELNLADAVKIRCGDVFNVVRREVTGGFEESRVKRELQALTDGGQKVTLAESAVVYHGLNLRPGYSVPSTDVLVPIPSGYPASMIDYAYLPDESPLFGKVKGQPQDHRIKALDRMWRQVSYHPHNGGGAPAWNPAVHGFHTYLGELLSWLHDVQ